MTSRLPVLDHLAVIRFAGDDAAAFLHGQLSCHVTGLAVPASAYGSYNTPKGRMLATFLLVRHGGGFDMLIDTSIAAAVGKRLQMFVMRSKVRVSDSSNEIAAVGLLDDVAEHALGILGVELPRVPHATVDAGAHGLWTRLDGRRALGLVPRSELARIAALVPIDWASPAAWQRADILAGVPWITAATQDALVPQMANLDLIGGVHFEKGCYPGQEIVARTQHLGKVKRRMVLGHVSTSEDAPRPGDPVVGADLGDQASGLIVNVAADPGGGYDVLAVMQTSTIAARRAHLKRLDGPVIDIGSLPYPV